jgi:hypothetical protein
MKQHTIKDINGEAYEELPPETIYTRTFKIYV